AANSATAEVLRTVRGVLARDGLPDAVQQAGPVNYLARMIYPQGNVLGYRDGFFIVGVIFLAALVPALVMRQRRRRAVALPSLAPAE
ncbi:MAG: hypothetical protein KDA49_02570, partial [Rhodospirillaceae bacterium]|nr:hypothetical protein [Rhodospirillaceae bacterium]